MMTSEPGRNKGPKNVEKRLYRVCKKLKETEVRATMFERMIRENVVTSDVRSFINNQAKLKRVNKSVHLPTAREAMKNKLSDTLATMDRLSISKKELKGVLNSEFNYPKSKCRRVVRSCMEQAESHRSRHVKRLDRKFKHCRARMKVSDDACIPTLPPDISKIIEGVNIFNGEIEPEKSADPMICDRSIKLTKSELAFLRRGPGFMMR